MSLIIPTPHLSVVGDRVVQGYSSLHPEASLTGDVHPFYDLPGKDGPGAQNLGVTELVLG